jgi:hypothetical protein
MQRSVIDVVASCCYIASGAMRITELEQLVA